MPTPEQKDELRLWHRRLKEVSYKRGHKLDDQPWFRELIDFSRRYIGVFESKYRDDPEAREIQQFLCDLREGRDVHA